MSEHAPRHIAVVGAGALGGWTALHLARAGCRVTLIDSWGPGHVRSSSGGETRVIRRGYGPRPGYVPLVSRAFELWRALESERGVRLLDPRGVLWLVSGDGAFETESIPAIVREGAPHEILQPEQLAAAYPMLRTDDLRWALFEPDAGALFAARGCEVVADALRELGGEVRIAEARPQPSDGGRCPGVTLTDGSRVDADEVLFAAGPWLPRLFPEHMPGTLRVTRQEVMSFGLPPGETDHRRLPVWAEHTSTVLGGETFWYGIPGGLSGGFKLGEDTHGPDFDPTSGDRRLDPARLERARAYLAHRFPKLAGAPLIDARVCQYTLTADTDLVFDRIPGVENLWVLGGGSGHAYKLGPAVGELAARSILGDAAARAATTRFGLGRSSLAKTPGRH